MPFYFYSSGSADTFLYLMIIAVMIFSIWAQSHVSSTFKKNSKLQSSMTGYDAARLILDKNGLYDVKIERISGSLTDHYDPKANVIRLSEPVYDKYTVSAVGVAAHEAGHAVQYATHYAPIKLRTAIVPVCNFGSMLAMPLILIGLLINSYNLALAGVVGYGLLAFFQFVTLPVEFNASRRAISLLSDYSTLTNEQISASRKVLSAAAMTYVAAFAASSLQFLRLLLIVSRRRD
ncbi:MAG: zinc metallopeptidase [Clostridia bacterium]|nr:zinc metallopeptidase [Clostridia bacterium]